MPGIPYSPCFPYIHSVNSSVIYAGSGRNHSGGTNNHDHVHNVLFVRRKKTLSTAWHVLVYWMPPAASITEPALVMQVARFQQSDVIEIPSTSILYSSPSYSRIMSRRHCGCRGLLVGKRVQEVGPYGRRKESRGEKKK